MELVSGRLSWSLAFILYSLMPVRTAHWPAYLSSLTETARSDEPSVCTVKQTEREGDLLGPEPGIP